MWKLKAKNELNRKILDEIVKMKLQQASMKEIPEMLNLSIYTVFRALTILMGNKELAYVFETSPNEKIISKWYKPKPNRGQDGTGNNIKET